LFEEKREDVVVALSFQLYTSLNGTKSPLLEMYLSPTGPYQGANGMVLSPSEVRQLPLPRVKIKRLAQFAAITDEPYYIYLLGLDP
jgi:hypothetical protein